ncbi:MAG TPA: aminotransferase class I/II-fold pyridoxal phosphate-dependent enzyme [Kiritimatiellia bacterium]|mgnify:CR=1 FL=1|nr:aminotransferase class I/II-fold pyridoxal phosphate-dependent enzyme [Kiritimatiellia bacterium]HMO99876.1 aminotransferase class I/II-fold pyridoxal phosphate-dependent enzyme [Kiritimatiellia bacterium]HMP96747.1 aminotransferase class I/II-fold pyridoxal phosphate-dependent enzyme [Kiritimatiellia bacterium]
MSASKSRPERIAAHVRTMPPSGIRDFFDIVSTMKDVISLGIGEPDFVTPWHIRESAIFSLERGVTSYTSNLGLLSLRQALADYVERVFGPRYDPAREILVTVGVSEALDLVMRAILEPGDEVIFHEPCYVSYGPVITFAYGKPVPIATRAENHFALTPGEVAASITPRTRAIILNYPNNPTGAILPLEYLRGIAALAEEHDLIVIADDIYAELTYDGVHTSAAALPGLRDRTIFLHGFSKAWAMTGFRLGYACGPADLIGAMMKIHQYTMLCAPITSQRAALEALKNPDADIQEMRAEYQRRRNFIHASFSEMGIPCPRPAGAFYAFPEVRSCGMNSKDFAYALLDEEKVAVVPGTAFGACGEGHVRCSYATAMDDIKEAMVRFRRFVEKRRAH